MNSLSLWIIVPCYNECDVLPVTAPLFLKELEHLTETEGLSSQSRILFVDDGSTDGTWDIIRELPQKNEKYSGISLSRNFGHQNALLAGLMEAKDQCDITITIDCDGQDDPEAMGRMVREYKNGCEIVYGVRSERDEDSWFKRSAARGFYRSMNFFGADSVYDHADYRLVSAKVLQQFAGFEEVNIFLRGMFPLVGFKSTSVEYVRGKRLAGTSHYSLNKMFAFAAEGITSLSIKPVFIISWTGMIVSLLGVVGIIWAVIRALTGHTVAGWASIVCILCFLGGLQLLSIGIIGQYVGKTYLETKHRPRYIISDRTAPGEARTDRS